MQFQKFNHEGTRAWLWSSAQLQFNQTGSYSLPGLYVKLFHIRQNRSWECRLSDFLFLQTHDHIGWAMPWESGVCSMIYRLTKPIEARPANYGKLNFHFMVSSFWFDVNFSMTTDLIVSLKKQFSGGDCRHREELKLESSFTDLIFTSECRLWNEAVSIPGN